MMANMLWYLVCDQRCCCGKEISIL